MEEKKLYDITEVCAMLETTSRTLRFYEEKGIIKSTTVGISSRRQYTEKQISHIRNVLVLRTLGLSLKTIIDLQNQNANLKSVVLSKRAEIYASIDTRLKEINRLNEALLAIESGKNIFSEEWQRASFVNTEEKMMTEICAKAIVCGDMETLYRYFSPRMTKYMPRNVYQALREELMAPLGEFVSFDKIAVDKQYPNKFYQYIKYTKLGFKITFVFYDRKIDGLWFHYYDTKAR